jgi:hypothetical protein
MRNRRNPTWSSWQSMKQRCNTPTNPSYAHYGERGITYDPEWESYDNFLRDMGERPPLLTLDRIDNNKNYCKSNCRWADAHTQRNNRNPEKVRTVPRIDTSSGVLGVSWHSAKERWVSYFYKDGRKYTLYEGCDFFTAVCYRKSWELVRQRGA